MTGKGYSRVDALIVWIGIQVPLHLESIAAPAEDVQWLRKREAEKGGYSANVTGCTST